MDHVWGILLWFLFIYLFLLFARITRRHCNYNMLSAKDRDVLLFVIDSSRVFYTDL